MAAVFNPFLVENRDILRELINFHKHPSVEKFDNLLTADPHMRSPHMLSWAASACVHYPLLSAKSQAYIAFALQYEVARNHDALYEAHYAVEHYMLQYGATGNMQYIILALQVTFDGKPLTDKIHSILQ